MSVCFSQSGVLGVIGQHKYVIVVLASARAFLYGACVWPAYENICGVHSCPQQVK